MKYRKKPIVVEASQFLGFDNNSGHVMFSDRPNWLNNQIGKNIEFFKVKNTITIKTLEGDMLCGVGDYIIQGVNGELYPCKEDIFNKTYERVEE
jgi:hypothetical protein